MRKYIRVVPVAFYELTSLIVLISYHGVSLQLTWTRMCALLAEGSF